MRSSKRTMMRAISWGRRVFEGANVSSRSNATSSGITLELYKADDCSRTTTGPHVSQRARLSKGQDTDAA